MKRPRKPTKEDEKWMDDFLANLPKPEFAPCSQEVRDWFVNQKLPVLKDQALSELRRNGEFRPVLIGFMANGSMGVVDIAEATHGLFGHAATKDAVAMVHRIGAMAPGTYASVFCCESWILTRQKGDTGFEEALKGKQSIHNHPDREEAMMFNMLHYEWETNRMMQLSVMNKLIKVLGANPSPAAWRDTKYDEFELITDPMVRTKDGPGMLGRFVVSDPENKNDSKV